jgi:hypothetical protein
MARWRDLAATDSEEKAIYKGGLSMSETATTIVAAFVVAAVGGYLGYRVCKEKQRLAQMVMVLGPQDLTLLDSINALIAQGELEPAPA